MNGTLNLGPVPSGAVPGLGGGAAVVGVTGATLTSPVIVPGFGVTEWQTAGQTNTVAVTLGAAADATVATTLSPVLHWLSVSANMAIDVNLSDFLNVFFDDFSIGIFSGSIGSLLSRERRRHAREHRRSPTSSASTRASAPRSRPATCRSR